MAVKLLREHQIEAVAAIVRGLDIPRAAFLEWLARAGARRVRHGKDHHRGGLRKTIVPKGRILVVVPTSISCRRP
ncbi:hypothetical protein QA860_41440 [Streptomyces stelliscabiei]|uniref:hypothetical protein n=1 Tax=Streptomyces stelliscabiei TaxID=146820 RepID=UPI002FEF25EB